MKIASFETKEWINAKKDRRPMTDDEVLVTYDYGDGNKWVFIDRFNTYECEWMDEDNETVVAWMPLEECYEENVEDA